MPSLREPITDVVGLTVPSGSATRGAGNGVLRAGNDDRTRVTDWLQAQYVAGRLSSSELEERIEQALAARTMGELDALTADLPPIQSAPTPPSPFEAPRGRHHRRRCGPGAKEGFAAHATSYLLVMALLVTIWLLTSPGGYFWPVWPMLGWGIGVASHGMAMLRLRSRGSEPRSLGAAG
jgi:hypothetical protein